VGCGGHLRALISADTNWRERLHCKKNRLRVVSGWSPGGHHNTRRHTNDRLQLQLNVPQSRGICPRPIDHPAPKKTLRILIGYGCFAGGLWVVARGPREVARGPREVARGPREVARDMTDGRPRCPRARPHDGCSHPS